MKFEMWKNVGWRQRDSERFPTSGKEGNEGSDSEEEMYWVGVISDDSVEKNEISEISEINQTLMCDFPSSLTAKEKH